jgi:hypothetical protein
MDGLGLGCLMTLCGNTRDDSTSDHMSSSTQEEKTIEELLEIDLSTVGILNIKTIK